MIHESALEAALRHLSNRLTRAELELAQALGNLAFQEVLLAERATRLEKLEQQIASLEQLLDLPPLPPAAPSPPA